MLKDKKSRGHDDDVDQTKAIVLYNASGPSSSTDHTAHQDQYYYYYYYYNYNHDDNDQYQDLTHSLFNNEEDGEQEEDDDELDLGDHNGSVIDLVRNSNMEAAAGEDHDEDFKLEDEINRVADYKDFKLEDEIDRVADLFITKFHKHIRMQKLESFKRYQEMLQRSA
ncbi:DBH-like monooxygenase protein [Actinidia chinensis var. chinensis]|uniref:DBH-like monooxygenase protein n=1 Tax=Actinidia chinensis var. chinensis TaxID=1590841 RepID=A0A2R6P1M0_ACTCC|nr:DBH-like monooxygenase protein [Actinidia chinensis var. chinensis]